MLRSMSSPPLPALQSPRLLDQVRERIRYLHYSLRTEQAYVHWVRAFVRHQGMRHPREMGHAEVEAFLGCRWSDMRWRWQKAVVVRISEERDRSFRHRDRRFRERDRSFR